MPVSSTAHRIPAVLASKSRAAASAFTVSRERQMLVLARRFRLMLQSRPASPASGVVSSSNTSANASISLSSTVGCATSTAGTVRPSRSFSMQPTMRIIFTRNLGSAPRIGARVEGGAFSCLALATRLSRVHSVPIGASTRFHQSVSGSALRSSSQNDSVASTTDSLNSTLGSVPSG